MKEILALNIFFARWKKPRPYIVHINQNNFCNLRCPYCYGNYWQPKREDISTQDMKKFIDGIVELGAMRIMFCAAEPLMRKDIGELIRYAQSKKLMCGMNTNGHLVRKRIEDIKTLNTLTISIDGNRQHHDAGKGKGSYDIVIDAIKCAKEYGLTVHTSTMIGKDNLGDIEHIIGLAKEIGFMTEWLLPFYNGSSEWIPQDSELKRALLNLLNYRKKGYPVFNSRKSILNALNWLDYKNKRHISKKEVNDTIIPNCSAGMYSFIMENDGKIYPCGQQMGIYGGMDFRKEGLKKCYEFVKDNHCRACYSFLAMKDYTLLINNDLSVWWDHLNNVFMQWRINKSKKC